MMQVGIISLMHESNTFAPERTPLAAFQRERLLTGEAVREQMSGMHHEVGGFLDGLTREVIEAVPVFAAWAMPSGTIDRATARVLTKQAMAAVHAAGPLDGWLVAPHGAAVAELADDFDGEWLAEFRKMVGGTVPVIGTLDLHANLSPKMVASADAWFAYRTNPHLDQHACGSEAARLLARTLRGEVKPTTAAAFPPMVVNIEAQATAESPCRELYAAADDIRRRTGVLEVSVLLGFPYADVPELGAALTVTTDGDLELANQYASELADWWWDHCEQFRGNLVSPEDAVRKAAMSPAPVCLLDMGDNVGGGSSADSTVLLHELIRQGVGPSFAVLHAPDAVTLCRQIGLGQKARLAVGGSMDGRPVEGLFTIRGLFDGKFEELESRHGGLKKFNQGATAVVESDNGLTLMLTTLRTAPFSLKQLTSFGVDPARFRVVIAKGVHAPVAAYAPVCRTLIRVNTPGLTTADLSYFDYHNRRRPLYPFEPNSTWSPRADA
jgi:microcystin degradation protein MlrC